MPWHSVGNDMFGIVSDMDLAVLAYDGVFDSGISALLDVLDAANAMRGEIPHPPPAWRITTVGFRRRVRTGARRAATGRDRRPRVGSGFGGGAAAGDRHAVAGHPGRLRVHRHLPARRG